MQDRDSKAGLQGHAGTGTPRLSRRAALGGAAALAAIEVTLSSAPIAAAEPKRAAQGKAVVVASRNNAVVATSSGSVRGYTRNGIHTFKGIPYSQPTSGANRFMPPVKVTPWAGVRSSMHYGPVSPQPPRGGWKNDEEAFMFLWDDGIQGEDCLRVNVWTPGFDASAKRPVMVWLHGGGFVAGSGQELRSYDGESLARRGDVVVVSLNHRLGALGYLDLTHIGGDAFTASGNVGMLDIVAALEWVRDNIAAFGGDAGRVTIFGQSGGGGKVAALMAMPAARGLFHRAIVQSGSTMRVRSPDGAAKLTDEVLKELDLDRTRLTELQYLPYAQLVAAGAKVLARQPRGLPESRRMAETLGWGPVNDGTVIPQHPFDPVAPAISADVPMIVGTTLNEFAHNINNPDGEAMSEQQMFQRVRDIHGERAAQIVAVFRERTPDAKPFDIWSHIACAPIRADAIEQCTRKAAQHAAPAYLYWFTWQTPVLDGRPRAFHCAELPFVFNNAERCETMTGGGPEAIDLAHKMSDAWVRFARTGNPNGTGLPNWPAFSSERLPTMLFDTRCEVLNAPDAKEQAVIKQSS
jgi:para-nitrobenzyl esterase